jgi:hypothetical protein
MRVLVAQVAALVPCGTQKLLRVRSARLVGAKSQIGNRQLVFSDGVERFPPSGIRLSPGPGC